MEIRNDCPDLGRLKIIGAGGFGKVFAVDDNNVVKGITSTKLCNEAEEEAYKQKKVYEAFQDLYKININNKIANLVKKFIKVSNPISMCNNKIKIDNLFYDCSFLMEFLHGIPLKDYKRLDVKSLENLEDDYISEKGQDFELMMHLALNSDLSSKFYGINYSLKKIGKNNIPRGYFATKENIINKLLGLYNTNLTIKEIKNIMGFIYGWIYYYANIIPIDIEITLGIYDNKIMINVLDFGMTIDLTDTRNIIKNSRTEQFVNIINDGTPFDNIKQARITKKVLENLSYDLYCDLEDDSDCYKGFKAAKTLAERF